jgi:hypothetical protein
MWAKSMFAKAAREFSIKQAMVITKQLLNIKGKQHTY